MRVSVITVSFNSASTIADTLQSVARQSWPDVEHIVIDGASTDETLSVIRERGTHVARVVSERDRGIYDAMSKGVRVGTGEIVGFLNADDWYASDDILTDVAREFETSGLDALYGDIAFVTEDTPRRVLRRYRSNRFRSDRLAWGWMPAHPSLFVRRAVFDRVGLFSPGYRIAGDFEWIARAFRDGSLRTRYLPSVLVHMRPGGASTAGWKSTVLLNREMYRACKENGISTNWLKLLSRYPLKALEYFRK